MRKRRSIQQGHSIYVESSAIFSKSNISTSNRFASLSISDTTNDVQNQHQTSTPTSASHGNASRLPPRPNFSPSKNRRKILKGIIVNCNGLKSPAKYSQFQAMIDHHKPDVILGCESKLDEGTPTYSVFPSNYTVFRKDRNDHGGGVFVAVHESLILTNCPEFDSNSEIIWCNLQFTTAKPLFIAFTALHPTESKTLKNSNSQYRRLSLNTEEVTLTSSLEETSIFQTLIGNPAR